MFGCEAACFCIFRETEVMRRQEAVFVRMDGGMCAGERERLIMSSAGGSKR